MEEFVDESRGKVNDRKMENVWDCHERVGGLANGF